MPSRITRSPWRRAVTPMLTLVIPMLATGCSGEYLLGWSDAKIALVAPLIATDGNELFYLVAAGDPATSYTLYSLDVTSLTRQRVADDLPLDSNDIVANANWVAWVDRDAARVVVRNRASSEEKTYLPGLEGWEGTFRNFRIRRLSGDRLITQRAFSSISDVISPALGQWEYIILDLVTGEDTRVAHAWGYDAFAISDTHLAIFNDLPSDAENLGLELTTNLDIVDLATGERETIAPDIRVNGSGGQLFATGDAFVWPEFKPGGFRETLMTYDTNSGESAVLLKDTTRAGAQRALEDVATDRLLWQRIDSGLIGILDGISYEIESFDGEIVATFSAYGNPQFVGDYVVWIDALTLEFVVYDYVSDVAYRTGLWDE